MAGLMQWFQVTCPSCTTQLQVKLPEGITSVQCSMSECKSVFAVQVQPVALVPPGQAPAAKRSRKRKKPDEEGGENQPRALSAYNVFMKTEVASVKSDNPGMAHRDAFKLVRATLPA